MSPSGFLYAATGRLRTPWRLFIFAAVAFAGVVVLQPLALVLTGGFDELAPDELRPAQMLAMWVATAVAFWIAHVVCVRTIEKQPWSMVGLHREAARAGALGRGFVIGALAIGIPSALLVMSGWLDVEPTPDGSWVGSALMLIALLAPAALAEELMIRGYPFAVLREVWGWRTTLLVTSALFGLLHLTNVEVLGNPAIGIQAIVLVTLAGILLGAILIATGSLYAAWFAHFAWNWVMAAIFHAPVSGLPLGTPDYRVVDAGPDWMTGGVWGPEAGLGAGAGMIAALLYVHRIGKRGGDRAGV